MHPELLLLIGISFSMGFTPGPNNAILTASGIKFGFTRTLPNLFGIPSGQNSRFELGASVSAFYKFELIQNISMEQSINLYSDYFHEADNVDLDYILTFYMKINDFLLERNAYF